MKIFTLCFLFFISTFSVAQSPEEMIIELDIKLPTPVTPVANFVDVVRVGNLLYLSGKGPKNPDGSYIVGKVGSTITVEEAKLAAKLVASHQLAVLKTELGSLNRVKRIVKVLGMVNCDATFTQHPMVINGFSDVMVAVFKEKGKHARSAVGMNSLPFNMVVEIEVIVEIED
ncbi:RidA family protein [Lutibacter sp.]|uniref:RidA family protein n=1 Tax=Lutibacter sp. TaxID=1925666 RepID=UPI002734EE88|nr:RidA family protein [Lutibacter sp.]MDP3314129.1 RidA family protein [Lutibacter sp.]